MIFRFLILANFLLTFFINNNIQAQAEIDPNLLSVYIECDECDLNFIRKEINFVNFVRDRNDADVHIQSNDADTGGGGERITFTFYGMKIFKGKSDTLFSNISAHDTQEKKRIKLLRTIKLGLIPFVVKTDAANEIDIVFSGNYETKLVQEDPWNHWVFRTSLSSDVDGEKLSNSFDINTSLTATRITEDWKLRIAYSNNYHEQNFKYNNQDITNVSRSHTSFNHIIKSIDEHWSIGAWVYIHSSTYENIKFKTSIAPAVEFNVFPYSDFNSKQLRLNVYVWNKFHNYYEETIYFRTQEYLTETELSATFDYIRPWGAASISASASTHLQKLEKNRFRFSGKISFQLVKGLTFDLNGGYSAIHDQLSIPRSEASLEDVLLEQRELETDYDYWGSFGVSFTFGSIYNNIVNPRFGD